MSLTKYASFEGSEVLEVKGSSERIRTASLDKVADYNDYRTDDGYMYVRIRAISSRTNKNHDGWPSIELAGSPDIFDRHQGSTGFTVEAADGNKDYGFATFVGKPIFVDHNNTDPGRARGVIVDSKFNMLGDGKTSAVGDDYWDSGNADPEHMPPSEVELLLEIDAKSFPHFAKAVADGDIDGWSMGCDVEYSKCSHCGNKASSPHEYCDHIQAKGASFDKVDSKTGKKTSAKSYENCYGIGFFEISGVFDPADETALSREVKASVYKEADENPEPQYMHTKAPAEVDTLREEQVCPICGNDMQNEKCDVCGYIKAPDGFDNPDLTKHQELQNQLDSGQDPLQEGVGQPPAENEGSWLDTRKSQPTTSKTNSMNNWTPRVHSRVAGTKQRPSAPASDEPVETVTRDSSQPVTSALRTAKDLIEAAKANKENNMQKKAEAASGAPEAATPDKRVDVDGVGGVLDASNEQASKADAQVDVLGKGGTGVENVEADEHQSVEQTSDNAGFDKGGNPSNNSGPTKTWPNKNQTNPVTDKAFPTSATHEAYESGPVDDGGQPSAKGGAQPADPSGKPDKRVDLTEPVTSPANNSGATKTWSGTDGNGVTKQQNPVTNKGTQSGGITSHVVAIFKLADAEVELGLTPEDKKYDRIAELEQLSEEEVAAEHRAISRVKTAGLQKAAQRVEAGVTKLPSFRQPVASASNVQESTPVADADLDAALFTR